MDKLKDQNTTSKKLSDKSLLSRMSGGKNAGNTFVNDILFFTLAFLFSRCHLFFGAYPLGISLLALAPYSVLATAAGAALGALTMGPSGIIYIAIYGVTVVLRVLVSSDKDSGGAFFCENLMLRMSVGVICGFCAAVCEVILRGMTLSTMLYGLAMVFATPLATFLLSGLFGEELNLSTLLSSKENPLYTKNKTKKESMDILFFQLSCLCALFITALSLEKLVFFGISVSFVFINFIALLTAKRFGALRGAAVGFVSALGCAGTYSVSFALSGLASGIFFSLGAGYALAVGGGISALWGYYVSGTAGLLSTIPEFIIAAALVSPLLKTVEKAPEDEGCEDTEKNAQEMVGTMALTYQNKYSKNLDLLEMSLTSLSSVISEYSSGRSAPTAEEYRSLVISTADEHCQNCTGRKFCLIENMRPCMSNVDGIVERLLSGIKVCGEDVNGDTEFCQKAEAVAASINERVARAEENSFKIKDADATAEEYALISKLINEARCRDEEERRVNSALTGVLSEAVLRAGFEGGVIRAFGNRRKHIILAGEDESGDKISSPKLKKEIEKAIGVKLMAPEYFKHGKMALMECDIARAYVANYAASGIAGDENEVTGDTACFFESGDDRFYALLSDGMGKGEIAHETSLFVSRFLNRALDFGATKETILHMLNYIIRRKGDECSATVDLFELDLLSGEATFIKSGAAPSFVKRGSSLFRIRSQTAPIGLIKNIDMEKICVEIKSGDFVILLSDGILQTAEDSPWLIELIANSEAKTPGALANEILAGAKQYTDQKDDMTVSVVKIDEI